MTNFKGVSVNDLHKCHGDQLAGEQMSTTSRLKNVNSRHKEIDFKADKNGLRNTVFSVNGDKYIGEWKHNKRHGTKPIFNHIMHYCAFPHYFPKHLPLCSPLFPIPWLFERVVILYICIRRTL